MQKPKYSQKFRNSWLEDPFLQKWLITKTQVGKKHSEVIPYCKVCHCSLNVNSKLSDLKNHAVSKSMKNLQSL